MEAAEACGREGRAGRARYAVTVCATTGIIAEMDSQGEALLPGRRAVALILTGREGLVPKALAAASWPRMASYAAVTLWS